MPFVIRQNPILTLNFWSHVMQIAMIIMGNKFQGSEGLYGLTL